MKPALTILFLFLFKTALSFDVIDEVSNAFKTGNSKELSKYFSSTIELSILNEEEIYSGSQAEIILKDFFLKHPPIATKIIHKVISNANYKFGVLVLNTSKGNFRVSYELKNMGGKFLINQIRIEENKA